MTRRSRKVPQTYTRIDIPYQQRYTCFYCGDFAIDDDHVPPVSRYYDFYGLYNTHKPLLVPSCKECNSLLKDTLQKDLYSRFDECKVLIINKISKFIRYGELWDSSSIADAEFTGSLDVFSKGVQKHSKIAKDRISWPGWEVSLEGVPLPRCYDTLCYMVNGKKLSSVDAVFVYAKRALKIPAPYLEQVLELVGTDKIQYAIDICTTNPVKNKREMEVVLKDLEELLFEINS